MTGSRVIDELFEDLAQRGHDPLMQRASGVLRIELAHGRTSETWTLSVDRGDLAVTRGDTGDAECTFRCERAFFERLILGQENAMAASLRGDVVLEGACWRLLVALQRLLPDAPVIALEGGA